MNGAAHYREAERLIKPKDGDNPFRSVMPSDYDIDLAQVHATLALAAATALQWHLDLLSVDPDSPGSAWRQAIS